MQTRKIFLTILLVAIIGGAFIGGTFFGYSQKPAIEKVTSLINKEKDKPAEIDFSPFWTTWSTINDKYVSSGTIGSQDMVWGAIEGLVGSLNDPYSVFFPPKEAKDFENQMRGDFSGVGMEIAVKKGILIVIAPLKNTPAEKAGIKAGDAILKIDDKMTNDMTADEAAQLIRGKNGTSVKLTILKKNQDRPSEITLVRTTIRIPVLDTGKKLGGIFVIKMYNFSADSSGAFRFALREFVESGSNKLILDLRNNPGGYLESSIDIASWFLPAGKIVAKEKFRSGEENVFKSKGYDIFKNLPMVILVNEGSASASEILAGALQEHGIATLVGEKTFGKGSVQELISITPETSLKLTIAHWLTPNGKSISEQGLEPDIKAEMTEKDIEEDKDPQMEKAIEILRNQ